MKSHNISKAFFGDGDSSVFVNIHQIDQYRQPKCDAVINIDRQKTKTYWVGAGEASIWSIGAIEDFCRYIILTYIDIRNT